MDALLKFLITKLYELVNNPIGFTLSDLQESGGKIKLTAKGKVIAFEIHNEGFNSNLQIGQNGRFITIPPCQSKPFALDSWFFYCDELEYKFEEIDSNLSEHTTHKGVLFEKYLKKCC